MAQVVRQTRPEDYEINEKDRTITLTEIGEVHVEELLGVPLRDPDHNAALYIAMVGAAVALLIGLDVAIRGARRTRTWRPSRAAMAGVRRERWTRGRWIAVYVALISFYLAYMAYCNLKSVVPLLRPGDLFDDQLAHADRTLFDGHTPAVVLHSLLGTGISAQILSTAYVAFIVFLPLSLALALVFSADLRASQFMATALSVNWLLGAATYVSLPALGPIYAHAADFAGLPASEVTHLQHVLMDQRIAFLARPATATPQAIAAFASLHIGMSFTAVLAGHLLGLRRKVKIGLWIWLALTWTATIYLGWHYVVDDLAGLVLGAAGLLVARLLTGFDLAAARRARRGQLALAA
jgi:hypothetical protein